MHPSPTRAQVYQMDDPCYHIGGGVPQIDLKIKKSYVVSQEALHKIQVVQVKVVSTSGVIPTIK